MEAPFDVKVLEAAKEAGKQRGLAVASGYFDDNTTHEEYQNVLRGLKEGDDKFIESLPLSPLSGEMAGDPTPKSVLEDLGVSEDDENAEFYIGCYEEEYEEAFLGDIERVAEAQVINVNGE